VRDGHPKHAFSGAPAAPPFAVSTHAVLKALRESLAGISLLAVNE
jgi:hypothetical protein